MSRSFILTAFALSIAAPAAALPLTPIGYQTATSSSVSTGLGNDTGADPTSSFAIVDALGLHAQSAGRSRPGQPPIIAANGSYDSPDFLNVQAHAEGMARQEIMLQPPVGLLTMHFVLPALLLVLTDNGERFDVNQTPIGGDLQAMLSVRICLRGAGIAAGTCPFALDASLRGHYLDERLTVTATSTDPALDLGSFANQVPVISTDAFQFQRTATWDFGGFEGDIDLTPYGGREFSIVYDISAWVDGRALSTAAAAAFNDPFLFEADPTAAAPIAFDFLVADPAAVPAPGGLGALAMALCGFAAWRRRFRLVVGEQVHATR